MPNSHPFRSVAATVDSVVALTLGVCVLVWTDQGRLRHTGVKAFFATQLSVLDLCFFAAFVLLWFKVWEMLGLYGRSSRELSHPLLRILAGSAITAGVLDLYLHHQRPGEDIRRGIAGFFLAVFCYQIVRELLSRRSLRWDHGQMDRVVILGTGRRASKAWRELRTRHHGRKTLLGFIDDRSPETMPPDVAEQYLGNTNILSEYLLKNVVDELIVAVPMRSCYDLAQRAISVAEAAGVRVVCLHDSFSIAHGANLRRAPGLFLGLAHKDEEREIAETLKRSLDVTAAALGLILLSPLFVIIGLAVKLTSPGPVFFGQMRYGYGRRQFRMYKFRSMVQNAPELMASLESKNEAKGPIFKMRNDPRVTRLGRFLRSTSLDELPQLWNVLIGDMSLVGPRPMSLRDVSLFSQAQLLRRFSVRPGITGRWQVAGRSSLSFEQWIALDFSYIDEWSLGLDLRILAQTVPAVLRRHGAV